MATIRKSVESLAPPGIFRGRTGADAEKLERPLEPGVAGVQAIGYTKFAIATVGACLALLAATLLMNVLVDPFAIAGTGLLPTAVEADRTVKLDLIRKLERSPDIVILGSSRARQAEPSFLTQLTGETAFNAAVTGGTAADAWVTARYVNDRFPRKPHHYIWFVDAGIATKGINPQLAEDPRGKRYLAGKGVSFTLADVGTYIGPQASLASWRVLDKCFLHTCKARLRYLPDGAIARPTLRYLPEHATSLQNSISRLVDAVRAHPPRKPNTNPARYQFFERTLAFMNAHGVRPVIVLNPIHPKVLAELHKQGFAQRRASLAYLHALHRRYDFVFVDGEDIRRWSGSPQQFTNATHINRRNMRRLLRYVVAHSDGALK